MKSRYWVGFLGLCFMIGLLSCSQTAQAAAREGLSLWWEAVLPTLFPFYVGTGLLLSGGGFEALSRLCSRLPFFRKLPSALPGLFLLGAGAGYPMGARLSAETGLPSLAPYVNLASPVFIIGVIGGLLGSVKMSLPILVGHILSALILLILRLAKGDFPRAGAIRKRKTETSPLTLPEIISEGMLTMLKIGGSIVFFLVFSSLLEKVGLFSLFSRPLTYLGLPQQAIHGLFTGFFEFTGGCKAIIDGDLPLRLTLGLLSALVSFGGLCVYLQAALFLPREGLSHYLPVRFWMALLSGGITYWIAPLFFESAVTAANLGPGQIKENALTGAALFFIAAAAMAFIYLLSVFLSRIRHPGAPGV